MTFCMCVVYALHCATWTMESCMISSLFPINVFLFSVFYFQPPVMLITLLSRESAVLWIRSKTYIRSRSKPNSFHLNKTLWTTVCCPRTLLLSVMLHEQKIIESSCNTTSNLSIGISISLDNWTMHSSATFIHRPVFRLVNDEERKKVIRKKESTQAVLPNRLACNNA